MRRGAKPAKAKREAKSLVAKSSGSTKSTRIPDLEQQLAEALKREAEAVKREAEALKREAEALEQQTATAEILRVISSSPTDVQPVFEAILRSAVRLCDGAFGNLYRFDGKLVHQVANYNFTPEAREVARHQYPAPLTRGLVGTRAILDRRIVEIPDVGLDPEYDPTIAQAVGFRSVVGVPMFREGSVVGTINIGRVQAGPFPPKQIEL